MNIEVPAAFQLRVELQALSNALLRATSDRLKLLRLAENALRTVSTSGLGDRALAAELREIRDTLAHDRALDRAAAASTFRRLSAMVAAEGRRPVLSIVR